MEKEYKSIMGLRAVLFVALVLLLTTASAQDPPIEENNCLFYAYTSSESHYFLLENNSKLFGQELNVKHNCEYLEIRQDGEFLARSNSSFNIIIDEGMNNFTFETNQQTKYFTFEVYPDRLNWQYEYSELQREQKEFISIDASNLRENYAVGFGILIVWVLTTYVYWRLIESYVNKNFIEEVTQ